MASAFSLFDFEFALQRSSSIRDCFGIADLPNWCSSFGGGGRSGIMVFESALQVIGRTNVIAVGLLAKKDIDVVHS